MDEHRGKLSIILIGIGIAALFWLPGLIGIVVGPIFFILFLILWAVPIQHGLPEEGGTVKKDRRPNRYSQIALGVGLGMLAALVFAFVPPEVSTLLIIIGFILMILYWMWLRYS